jgi:hypothetical protein
MGPSVPHFKSNVVNLLKVVDLSQEDRSRLIELGFGDLLANPGQVLNKSVQKKQE